MTNQNNPLSLPTRHPPRTESLSIRLSPAENTAIEALAKHLQLPTSQMARHFLLQAVNHYLKRLQAEALVSSGLSEDEA
jgi:predicted transcriptional regulator